MQNNHKNAVILKQVCYFCYSHRLFVPYTIIDKDLKYEWGTYMNIH